MFNSTKLKICLLFIKLLCFFFVFQACSEPGSINSSCKVFIRTLLVLLLRSQTRAIRRINKKETNILRI